jgi:putative hydrolase of HD superfamily
MTDDRLSRQMEFIVEADRLKQVLRRTVTIDENRNENSAEHSWHISLMALLLSEYAAEKGLDLLRTVKLMLVHDLVEIDAGDTYCHDQEACKDQLQRETRAAERLFRILPDDQAAEVRALWDEFEAGVTAEAKYANALDRLQALLLNYHAQGRVWAKFGITAPQVLARARPIEGGAPALWRFARDLIDQAVVGGLLEAGPKDGPGIPPDRGGGDCEARG